MKIHIVVLYLLSITALVISITSRPNNAVLDYKNLTQRVDKIDFYQEASRVMNNLIGFDQVFSSFPTDKEKSRHCLDNADLLREWQGDVDSLNNLDTSFVSGNEGAKNFLNSIKALYEEIKTNCAKAGK